MSQGIIIIIMLFAFLFTCHLAALPILPDPDPAIVQTQNLLPSPPTTIPAFPEQSDAAGCPLDMPEDLFHGIKSACGSKSHHRPDPKSYSGQLHRTRCCPVLAAWLYSAYSKTALHTKTKPEQQTASYEMPVLPDDSETCVDTLEKELENRGIELGKPNDTCDVVYCYCDIRLHPFSCPEAFSVNSHGKLVGNEDVKKLERDCVNGGYAALGGCSKCLNTLYLLGGDKAERNNKSERTSKMHNQDCELMGLTWLLSKDRPAYIHTVSAVLRALMMRTEEDDATQPMLCSLNSDGMPLAVDSSEINSQSSSTILPLCLNHYYPLQLSLLYMTLLFLFSKY